MSDELKQKFYCDKCNYTCYHESHWKQHSETKKHNNIKRKTRSDKVLETVCKFCSFEAKNSSNMRVHILTKHSTPEIRKKEFKYYCEKCDAGTFTKILFQRHLETQKHIKL
jgi:ribosomal protein L35